MQIKISDMEYRSAELRKLAKQLTVIRNGALDTAAMEWAVVLSHAVAVINTVADEMEPTHAEG